MTERIKAITLAKYTAENKVFDQGRDPDTNTHCLIGQHISSVAFLPDGHPVRRVFAIAAVEGYVRHDKHKFSKEICKSSNFAADLLLEVKETFEDSGHG